MTHAEAGRLGGLSHRKGKSSGTDFSKASKMKGDKSRVIGKSGVKSATGRVKISKVALKRREEKYGKEVASKMGKWSE